MDKLYTYYINLDRRTDRNTQTIENLKSLGFIEKNINRFSAINGLDLVNDLVHKNYINDPIINRIINLNTIYNSCTLACMLSHYFTLKQIVNNTSIPDDSLIFVFEDDFFVNQEYLENKSFESIITQLEDFSKNNSWEMIYLGGRFEKNFIPNIDSSYQKIDDNIFLRLQGSGHEWCRTAHNYIVNKKNAEKLCNLILENFNSNHFFREIDTLFDYSYYNIIYYDYFPHIFYSPVNYTTDIQHNKMLIHSSNFIL